MRITRFIIIGLISLSLFFPANRVSAHPADMYAQQQTILLTADDMQVDWKVTPGPLLAGALWDGADLNHDGSISRVEAFNWFRPYASLWQASLDRQPLAGVQVTDVHWPDRLDRLQSGDDPIEVQFYLKWPAGLTGKHQLTFHNAFQESISINWFTLKSQPSLVFDEPAQNNSQLQTNLYFLRNGAPVPGQLSALTSWESGKPTIPGINGAILNAASRLTASGQDQPNAASQANPISGLLSLMRTRDFSPLFLAGAFLLSLVLGSLHALTPGHGKALVAAYLVGSQGKVSDAVFLGLVVTLTHTGSVLLLGLITLIASRYILPALIIPWLEVISGLFVFGFGLNLLWVRGRALSAALKLQRSKQDPGRPLLRTRTPEVWAHGGEPYARTRGASASQHLKPRLTHRSLHQAQVQPDHPASDGEHSHGGVGRGHSHALPSGQVTWKSLLTLGISGGLVPCPDAIAILLVAVAINRILFGMLLITAFSIGLAGVLIAIGLAMVGGMRLLHRSYWMDQFSVYAPLASAAAVLVLGISLTLTTFLSGALTSAAAPGTNEGLPAPAAFDINRAKLVYLAPDSTFNNQLYLLPLSGGAPAALTHVTAGILEFRLSPDAKTILYTTLDSQQETAIWAIHPDGSQKKEILACPQSYCAGPEWFPDGTNLVYQRRNYSQNSAALLYSIWWLDPGSGQTRPVFRDQQFPSFAPRFSFDGRWLSYISPSNNTLQIYNLESGQRFSRPYPSGLPEVWSPVDQSFLFWDLVVQGEQSIHHLSRYDLASGHTVDLSAAREVDDTAAAWSPDGNWIAVIRTNSLTARQQVWLVRPDGSQAHVLLDQDNVSYGDDLNWSPDSQYLLYSLTSYKGSPPASQIWMVNTRSGQQKKWVTGGSQPVILP